MIKDMFVDLIHSLIMRDPCRRCIIKIMCSQECSENIKYTNYMGPQVFYRLVIFSIIFSLAFLIFALVEWVYTIII